MRHTFRTLILAMAAVLAVASCTEKEPEDITLTTDDSKVYLKIGSVTISELTKAAIEGTSFPTAEDVSIGLFVRETEGTGEYGYITYNWPYENVKCTRAAGQTEWVMSEEIELDETSVIVYAYYPWKEGTGNDHIDVYPSVDGDDWMWGTPVENVSSASPDISLSMNHALARISLSFKLDGTYMGDGSLSEISLSGDCVAAGGTLDATDGSITATASKFTAGTEQTLSKSASITLECLVVPVATSDTPEFKIDCTIDGKAYAATFTGDIATLTQGKQTTIGFTVLNTSIEVDATSINGWDANGTQEVIVGGNHKVTIKLADGIPAHDVLADAFAEGSCVLIRTASYSGQHLKCTMPDGEFCTSQNKTGNLAYTFTLSDITSNTVATIGYAKPVSLGVIPSGAGSIEVSGGELYEGETVNLKAIPGTAYGVDTWLDGDGEPLSCEDETCSNVRLSSRGMSIKFKENLILSGEFTVTRLTSSHSRKKVRFTRGNLYYDAQGCKVENHQYDFNAADYTNDHVSHFTWCNDFGKAASQMFDRSWLDPYPNIFFTEQQDFSLYGLNSSEYKFHTLTNDEWYSLFSYGNYDNDLRRDKYKSGVTICGKTNCVVLLPDNSELKANDIKDSYNYAEWKYLEDAGAVCLPAAGFRNDAINGKEIINEAGITGHYWSASPNEGSHNNYKISFNNGAVFPRGIDSRFSALSVRLVTYIE